MNPDTEFILAIVCALVFGALAVLCTAAWIPSARDRKRKFHETSVGKISGRILDERKPYLLTIGGIDLRITGEQLKRGINLGDPINRLFSINNQKVSWPLKMYEENNRLLVDVEIHNEKGDLVCSIVHNDWQFNPDGKYDKNSSINAFEIIDVEKVPVLQIKLEDPNKIYVGGFIHTSGGAYFYFTPGNTSISSKVHIVESKRLFKYPSSDNLGKMEDVKLESFKNYDDEAVLDQLLIANKASYKQLTNDDLKLKASKLATQLTQMYQPIELQINNYDWRKNITAEENEMLESALKNPTPEKQTKRIAFLKKLQDQQLERIKTMEVPMSDLYNKNIRPDAILTREEILSRLKELPEREFSNRMMDLVYRRCRGTYDLKIVANDLNLLKDSLPQ